MTIRGDVVRVWRRPIRTAFSRTVHLDIRPEPSLELARARHVVCLHMRFDDVADVEVVLLRVLKVRFDIPRRIDHGRSAAAFVAHNIRRDRQSRNESLIEQHGAV